MVAFFATMFHFVIDLHLGIYGPVSANMSVVKGLWGLSQALLFAWWMLMTVLAIGGDGTALRSSIALTAIVAFALNGVVALIAAPPVSAAAPWQDLAHFGAVGGGFVALRTGVRELRLRGSPPGGRLLVISVGLLLVNVAFGIPVTLEALSG